MKTILQILFLLIIHQLLYAQTYPDNIKNVDCFSTVQQGSPWGIRLAQTSTVTAHEYYTPLAGDLNGDGIPEIVVAQSNWVGHNVGRLVVFSGNDVSQSAIINLNTDMSYYSGAPYGMVRLPDPNNPTDTVGLIIVRTILGLQSYKFDNLSSITVFDNYVGSVPSGTIGFADFNNDSIPEVYIGNMVFDAYSLDIIGTGSSNSGASFFHWFIERVSYAADVLPAVPGTELICGSVIYSVDVTGHTISIAKTITPPAGFSSDGQTEVADFNNDGVLDVLVKQNSSTYGIYAYSPLTGNILFSKIINADNSQNFPMIGDIDSDGYSEIVILYPNTLKAFKFDGITLNEFWSATVSDPSGSTGMTLFDFNQDGIKEIVYRDDTNMRIINGSKKSHITGADTIVYNLAIFAVKSSTVAEFPIVVDCDMDNEAEIVTTGTLTGGTGSRLHVFKSIDEGTWAPARPVWNQYAYNVTNVNQDLTIPPTIFNNATYFPNGKQPFNNFQEQATILNQHGDMILELQKDTIQLNDTICEGQYYLFYSDTLTVGGIYTKTTRCDSTFILNLTVNPRVHTTLTDSFCLNNTYLFNGKSLLTAGIYKDTLLSALGCDSIITLTLTEIQPIIKNIAATICQGSSYFFAGLNISAAGIYTDTLSTAFGCDSIVILDLSVTPPLVKTLSEVICFGNPYIYRSDTLTLAGTYRDTLQTVSGCDSIVVLDLAIVEPDSTILQVTINQGDSYYFGNRNLNTKGIYKDTLLTIYGCDSILILNLSINMIIDTAIVIPEIFSPNDDGINDLFEIKNLQLYPKNKILICNRWGNKVYEASPYLNNWDGTNQFGITIGGNILPVGTYFYLLNLDDGSETRKGFIYLNR